MKKLFATLIVLALVLTSVFALVACNPSEEEGEKSAVELAIEAAQKMSLEELEAASKKEMQDNPDLIWNADSLTSGVNKVLSGFIDKYDWITADNAKYNSKKGSEYQPKLTAANDANQYIADFVMIQDAAFVDSLVKDNFLLSYVPNGDGYNIAESDQNPLVGVTFNKIFYYNSVNGDNYLKNVWQLTGVDGTTLKGMEKVSYQSPLGEDVNMSFLIMLTSPAAVEKLTAAYKTYFGKDYKSSDDDYINIGYKFVAEFIANISTWHTSDTSEVKAMNDAAHQTGVYFAGLAKVKDYNSTTGITDPEDPGYWKNVIKASGYNYEVEGFDGFVYNMWTLIPKTAKLPYTSCLFIRYMLSEEGYAKGFSELGYYCSNTLVPSMDTDPSLNQWRSKCIVEDVDYINSVYGSVVKFINQQLA